MTRLMVEGKPMPSLLGAVRERVHPLHQMRRVPVVRSVLSRLDVPIWAPVHGVRWRVRVRLVRDASYVVLRGSPEPHVKALVGAAFDVFRPRTFWDVGAHFGYYGLLAKSIDDTVSVVFCEPDPGNARLLAETLSRISLDGMMLLQAAVSDTRGTALFAADVVSGATGSLIDGGPSASGHQGARPRFDVKTVTLDDVVGDAPLDMLKVDVEGHEEAVVRGGLRTFERCKPLVVFECFHGGGEMRLMLEPLGYEIFDAERLTSPSPSSRTSNFFGLPPQHRGEREALLAAWRARL